jgi:hypothetical protein
MGDTQAPGAAEKELRSDQEHASAAPAQVIGSGKPPKRSGSVGAAADAATKRMAAGGGAASADPDLPGDFSRADPVVQLFAGGSDLAAQIERLGTAGRLAFASHLPAALDDAQRAIVRSVFEATPDGEVATLEKLIAAHFSIRAVGPGRASRGVDWDAVALRRAWRVLESLPVRATDGIALHAAEEEELETADQRADPLAAANPFLEVVRHEIGHFVDGKLGLAERWCLGKPAGGDWRLHGDDARVELGEGRVLVQGCDGSLASYATEALSRRVSDLQFRAPGEWIAEAWAAWRASLTDGEDRLGEVDPATRAWLDSEIGPALQSGGGK